MKIIITLLFAASLSTSFADASTLDLQKLTNADGWTLTPGFKAVPFESEGKVAIKIISESQTKGGGLARLTDMKFQDGEIECDILGAPTNYTFLGLALRVQNERDYDLVYFRPMKFGKPKKPGDLDGEVQYSSEPKFGWKPLREQFPMKYEKNLTNPPNDGKAWFHVRLVIAGPKISAYFNGAAEPCLTVEKSLSGRENGSIGLWTWPGGAFANLKVTPAP